MIAIENKINSQEHSDQLARYRQTVAESSELSHYAKPQYVFLTRDGDEPTDSNWTIYTYADLHRSLSRCREINHSQMGDDVLAFLDHYLRLVGSRMMDDAKITELCQEIYKNHRQAIDLIRDRVADTPFGYAEVLELLQNSQDWQVLRQGKASINFTLNQVSPEHPYYVAFSKRKACSLAEYVP